MSWNLTPNDKIRIHRRSHLLEDRTEGYIVAEDPGKATALFIETFERLDAEEHPYVTAIELVASENNMGVHPLLVQRQEDVWIKKTWDTAATIKTPGYRDFTLTRDTNLGDVPRDVFGTPYPNCTVTKGGPPPECHPNSWEEHGDTVFNETRKSMTQAKKPGDCIITHGDLAVLNNTPAAEDDTRLKLEMVKRVMDLPIDDPAFDIPIQSIFRTPFGAPVTAEDILQEVPTTLTVFNGEPEDHGKVNLKPNKPPSDNEQGTSYVSYDS